MIAPLFFKRSNMAVYSLGERRVQVQGKDWYIAESATVIGSVLIEDKASIWFNVAITTPGSAVCMNSVELSRSKKRIDAGT